MVNGQRMTTESDEVKQLRVFGDTQVDLVRKVNDVAGREIGLKFVQQVFTFNDTQTEDFTVQTTEYTHFSLSPKLLCWQSLSFLI